MVREKANVPSMIAYSPYRQSASYQWQRFLNSSGVYQLGVLGMCAHCVPTPYQPPEAGRRVAERPLIDISRYCHFGLNYTDGALTIAGDLFKPHLPLLFNSKVECGGWFEGSFTGTNDKKNVTLEISYARSLPKQYWGKDSSNDFVDIPATARWFADHQKLGLWHLHRMDLPPTVQDVYDEFAIIVIRKRSWFKSSLGLYIISRTPFSKISLVSTSTNAGGEHGGGTRRVTTVTTLTRPPWVEIVHPVLNIINQKRFALPSSLKIDGETGLIYETG